MKTSTITLWENPQANFRLTLNTLYEKTKPDGTTQNKVYYNTQTEALNANAGVFLCFWYYVPEDFRASQAVFTASSHIYYIRKMFREIESRLAEPDLIVGDDKQVSPSSIGIELDQTNNLLTTYLKDKIPNWHLYNPVSSLYDITGTTFQPLMLREHFRCVPDIIGYSNKLSYNFKIITLTSILLFLIK